jgi:hypothetical protein
MSTGAPEVHRSYGGGIKYLWNLAKLLPDYTAQYPRRQPSSYSPPSEPEISAERILFEGELPVSIVTK